MVNIKLVLAYDGTNYHGWQVQGRIQNSESRIQKRTIQGTLEEALAKITKERIRVVGAGRTDAGVHAYGQVANFKTKSSMSPQEFQRALNSMLPEDIVIKEATLARADFHAQFDAIGKRYQYVIYQGPFPLPFLRDYALWVPYELSIKSMRAAAKYLRGRHDFSSFRLSGSAIKDPVRTITKLSITSGSDMRYAIGRSLRSLDLIPMNRDQISDMRRNDRVISFNIEADGFLRGMVRSIAGTLLEVGRGKIPSRRVPEILLAKDRRLAGPTLPPKGLYLMSVEY